MAPMSSSSWRYWRLRAEEVCTLADDTKDAQAKGLDARDCRRLRRTGRASPKSTKWLAEVSRLAQMKNLTCAAVTWEARIEHGRTTAISPSLVPHLQ